MLTDMYGARKDRTLKSVVTVTVYVDHPDEWSDDRVQDEALDVVRRMTRGRGQHVNVEVARDAAPPPAADDGGTE